MSQDRREFIKTITLGGVALFTADWFAAVKARQAETQKFRLPAYDKDPVPDGHDVINAVWNAGTGYILYLNGTPYDEPPKITLREKLEEEGEDGLLETLDSFTGKYSAFIWSLEDLDADVEEEQVDALNDDGESFEFVEGETWRDFLEREDGELLAEVESIADEWGGRILYKLDDRIDWDDHEDWLTDWCRNHSPESDALGYVEGLFDALEEQGEDAPALNVGDSIDLDGIYQIDGASPGNDTLRCAVAPDYDNLAALQRAIDVLGWQATVVLLEPKPEDRKVKA